MTSVGPTLDDDCDEKIVATMLELPAAFVDFLNEHEIDPHVYDVDPSAMPRYFRTKDESVTKEELRKHFDQVERVPWLRCFYAISSSVSLATSELYVGGKIYGMEASSGFAVTVLDPQPGDHVLDLCCAPGAKLTMLADVLQKQGSITGVDFSKSRIAACRTLVHKYDLIHSPAASWRCRLFHADGRTFDVRPESNDTISALETILDSAEVAQRSQKTQTRKRMNKSARARLAKQAKDAVVALGSSVDSSALYDKVLVDAECTHDGSLRHLTKLKSDDEWTQYLTKYLNREHVQGILDLQHDLIRNGFRLLREGGRMVYSTCSLSRKQNEEIVASFLKDTPTAELVPFDTTGIPHQPGHLDHTIRFTPLENMGGLFVSLITKKPSVKRIKLSNADDV
ncbi:unnamed protein product [Aphanomyces euteiches]|uniref:SAM-dependent MTase RsmB/NOP-type domain-containing protein n=1 Tax=Aphanomyces euteiches TaxID=100861 RepID=A0A6G0XXY0_9STRA|nr:hypothetical protein Ae201684_000463 [Aphanomyces euteiches]KAH9091415.1 hypothetical protein Ae201684P_010962 [Aphanomyces euteiches]KAH9146002.1 hypothetical protein AeRB84_010114 [Aphanomyces euteiches]